MLYAIKAFRKSSTKEQKFKFPVVQTNPTKASGGKYSAVKHIFITLHVPPRSSNLLTAQFSPNLLTVLIGLANSFSVP